MNQAVSFLTMGVNTSKEIPYSVKSAEIVQNKPGITIIASTFDSCLQTTLIKEILYILICNE